MSDGEALVELRSSRTAAEQIDERSTDTASVQLGDSRQAGDVVCGGGSRVSDGQKPGTAAERPQARNVPRSERGVGGGGGRWAETGAYYILHLRESNPRSVEEHTERRSAGGSV